MNLRPEVVDNLVFGVGVLVVNRRNLYVAVAHRGARRSLRYHRGLWRNRNLWRSLRHGWSLRHRAILLDFLLQSLLKLVVGSLVLGHHFASHSGEGFAHLLNLQVVRVHVLASLQCFDVGEGIFFHPIGCEVLVPEVAQLLNRRPFVGVELFLYFGAFQKLASLYPLAYSLL